MPSIVLLRGGGDLASGVALRLHRAGIKVLITELSQPLVVRRKVSFAEAVYNVETQVEGVTAKCVDDLSQALEQFEQGHIPVMVDPQAEIRHALTGSVDGGASVSDKRLLALVDGRMTKHKPELGMEAAILVIGLGPGFSAGENCHAVVETNRGHFMGRVIWQGQPEADTGIPESVIQYGVERVLRSPADGILQAQVEIGEHLEPDQVIATVDGYKVRAPFRGVLRGVLHSGVQVRQGMKVGDVDPRDDPRYCFLVSDKSTAVGGGVLEALLTKTELRAWLWD